MRERFTFDALFAFCDLHASRVWQWQTGLERLLGNWPCYYDRQGFPIPADGDMEATLVWARQMEAGDRHVAQDDLPDGSWLSTVWLGLDHSMGGPPLIFETMRFAHETEELRIPLSSGRQRVHPSLEFPDPETGELTDQLRYTSEEEALAAHHEIVRRIRVREGH